MLYRFQPGVVISEAILRCLPGMIPSANNGNGPQTSSTESAFEITRCAPKLEKKRIDKQCLFSSVRGRHSNPGSKRF